MHKQIAPKENNNNNNNNNILILGQMAIQWCNMPQSSSLLRIAKAISKGQISQSLKFWYAQYMDNHNRDIWPIIHPNLIEQYVQTTHTWPHLLSTCTQRLPNSKTQQSIPPNVHTLQSNEHTHYHIRVYARSHNAQPWEITNLEWLWKCTHATAPSPSITI